MIIIILHNVVKGLVFAMYNVSVAIIIILLYNLEGILQDFWAKLWTGTYQ